jgi:hypothetical protein
VNSLRAMCYPFLDLRALMASGARLALPDPRTYRRARWPSASSQI